MGFYKSKLTNYLKQLSSDPNQLESTREKIMTLLGEHLKNYIAESHYYSGSRLGLSDEAAADEAYKKSIVAEQELNFLKTLSTDDFFRYLVNIENFNLVELENMEKKLMEKYAAKVKKYENQEGLMGRASAVFGTDKKKIQKNKSYLNATKANLSYIGDSRNELNALSEEEQVAYIVGRCEVENKVKFDLKGFDDYKKVYFASKTKNVAPQNESGNEKI